MRFLTFCLFIFLSLALMVLVYNLITKGASEDTITLIAGCLFMMYIAGPNYLFKRKEKLSLEKDKHQASEMLHPTLEKSNDMQESTMNIDNEDNKAPESQTIKKKSFDPSKVIIED